MLLKVVIETQENACQPKPVLQQRKQAGVEFFCLARGGGQGGGSGTGRVVPKMNATWHETGC